MTPSTTCPSWSRRREPWTRPLHLQGWDLPEEFTTPRRLLDSRMGRRGKREFVQVLRLMETFTQQELLAKVKRVLKPGGFVGPREMFVNSSFLEPNGGHPQMGKELKRPSSKAVSAASRPARLSITSDLARKSLSFAV